MRLNYYEINCLLNDLSADDTLNDEVETYLMNKLREELKPIIGDRKPTPPNPNAQQVCWQLKINIGGKRKKFTGHTEQALYRNIIAYMGIYDVTVQSYYDDWLSADQTISYATRTRKNQRWIKYFRDSLGPMKMSKLTYADIENAVMQMQAKGITTKDLNESLSPVRCICRKALREGLLSSDPLALVQIDYTKCIRSKKQNEKPQDRVFQADEMDKVIAVCNQMVNRPNNACSAYFGIMMLRLTGMRVGELVAVKYGDFDLDNLILHIHAREIPEGKKRIVVEGIKGTRVMDKTVITRDIPIPIDVVDLLQQICDFNANHGYEDDDYVFLGKSGRSSIKAIENALWNACRLAGLEQKKSPHDIRRTVATVLYRKGLNLKQIQYYLGHSDVETTKGYIYDDTITTSYYDAIRDKIK